MINTIRAESFLYKFSLVGIFIVPGKLWVGECLVSKNKVGGTRRGAREHEELGRKASAVSVAADSNPGWLTRIIGVDQDKNKVNSFVDFKQVVDISKRWNITLK